MMKPGITYCRSNSSSSSSNIPAQEQEDACTVSGKMKNMSVLEQEQRRRRRRRSPASSSSCCPSSSCSSPTSPSCYNSLSHHNNLSHTPPTTCLPHPPSASESSLYPTSSYCNSYYSARPLSYSSSSSSSGGSSSTVGSSPHSTSSSTSCLPVLSRRSCLLLFMLLLLVLPHICCASWSSRTRHFHRDHEKGSHRRRHTDGSGHSHHSHHHHNALSRGSSGKDGVVGEDAAPYFDTEQTREVKAQLGSHAYLPCIIKDLGDKSVSWVRNSDKHILTVDRYTFISDSRFTARYEPDTETWTLQVKFITASDAGFYECQVSTEPKISHFVNLNVIIPRVSVPGGSELYVRSGSTVTVKCVISNALHPPNYVFWYHESSRVVGGGTLPGVRQEPMETLDNGVSVSSLTIATASAAHAGNYTCSPAHLTPTSVVLHVLNGEHPAAMQHGTSGGSVHSMGHVGVGGWMATLLLLGLLHHRSNIVWAIVAHITAALLHYTTVQR